MEISKRGLEIFPKKFHEIYETFKRENQATSRISNIYTQCPEERLRSLRSHQAYLLLKPMQTCHVAQHS